MQQRNPVRTFPSSVQNYLMVKPCDVGVPSGVDETDVWYGGAVVGADLRCQ